ncbi:FtsX-like permease family protein, partial [Arthrospira platensis SPKY1]|nr:FtsX-like permease family protein [Arthrospira platensis SPKY1]
EMPQVIEHLQLQWDRYASGKPFSYRLQDQILSESYKQEGRIARLFGLAAIFTILVALLGLLGLTSFMAEQRTKEVGIRKILGASDMQLLRLLFSELLLLIVIAFVFAVPLAWWRLDIWLES